MTMINTKKEKTSVHPIARLCGAGRKGAVKEKGREIQGKRGRNGKKGEGKETARESTKTHIRFCAFVSHGPHVCAPVCAIPRVPVLRPCAFPSALRAKTVLSLCLRRAQAKGERRKRADKRRKGQGKRAVRQFQKEGAPQRHEERRGANAPRLSSYLLRKVLSRKSSKEISEESAQPCASAARALTVFFVSLAEGVIPQEFKGDIRRIRSALCLGGAGLDGLLRIACGRCFPARVQRGYPKSPLSPAPRRRGP